MLTLSRMVITFLVITGVAVIATSVFDVNFGNSDFWEGHGVFFLIAISVFPRLTLLFSSVATGGLLWWLSFLFMPRILVAVLATIAYWHQNPILVLVSWFLALGGEISEKFLLVKRARWPTKDQVGAKIKISP